MNNVADKHEHIDLVTLEEVQRLLADTDFASARDIAGTVGDISGLAPVRRLATSTGVEAGDHSPLPRRR